MCVGRILRRPERRRAPDLCTRDRDLFARAIGPLPGGYMPARCHQDALPARRQRGGSGCGRWRRWHMAPAIAVRGRRPPPAIWLPEHSSRGATRTSATRPPDAAPSPCRSTGPSFWRSGTRRRHASVAPTPIRARPDGAAAHGILLIASANRVGVDRRSGAQKRW